MVNKNMLVLVSLLLLFVCPLVTLGMTADSLAVRVNYLQARLSSYESNFMVTSSISTPDGPKAAQRQGTISFKAPSFWKIETNESSSSGSRSYTTICDGKNIWKFYPYKNRVSKYSVEDLSPEEQNSMVDQLAGANPMIAMERSITSITSMQENLGNQTAEIEMGINEYSSSLVPFAYDKIRMVVSTNDGLTRELHIYNMGSKVYSAIFTSIATDVQLADELFTFQAPEGVQIIDEY